MVLPSHALVLLVHVELRPGGVGWFTVVVVVVVVVVGVVWVLVAVALVVVVMVLRVCPEDPLAFLGAWGSGIVCSPWGRTAWWVVGTGWGAGLTATAVEGSHVPGSVWPAAVVGCGEWMTGRFEMRMVTRVWTGLCWVASRQTPLTAPHTRQFTHTRRGEPHAPRHTHLAQ